MSRGSCLFCVRKHLAQASILLDESRLGYPFHRWYAIGHLAEAESESLYDYPDLAKDIREIRLKVMHPEREEKEPVFDKILLQVCALAGDADDVELDEHNSKKIYSQAVEIDEQNPRR